MSTKNLKQNKVVKVFGFVLMLIGSIMLTNGTSFATSIAISTSGFQGIDIVPSAGTAIIKDSINVVTTCRYGYNFVIQTSVEDPVLYLDGDPESSAGTIFEPVYEYAPLNQTQNQWGYFYDDDNDVVPTGADVFSPVGPVGWPAIVKEPLYEPSSFDIDDNFNIYYGVSAAPNARAGVYKMMPDEHGDYGTIVYIATIADECASKYTVHFSPTSIFEGNTISGTGTMANQIINVGETTTLDYMGFTAPSGFYFAGWNTAQDGSGTTYTNRQQVTDITTGGDTITLYAMWTDCPLNTICYSPNVSNPNDVEGTMDNMQLRIYVDTYAVLHASNYSRENYGFVGWNTKSDGTGTYYGPNQTYEFNRPAGEDLLGLKLYAQWVVSAGNMQNWSGCSSMSIGDVTALKDTRDDEVYAVAKLADGKCWMIENLRLENTALHNSDGTLAQGYSSNFIGLANPESAGFDGNTNTPNSLYSTDGSTAMTITGNYSTYPLYRFPRYNNMNTRSRYTGASDYYGNSNTYLYGNYYTWAAAIADTTYYGTDGQSVTATSICPTGWHLPTGGAEGEFYALNTAVNDGSTDRAASNALRSYPNNFVLSGDFYPTSAFRGDGAPGVYISSMVKNMFFYYALEIEGGYVSPGTGEVGHKDHGASIRCVAGV